MWSVIAWQGAEAAEVTHIPDGFVIGDNRGISVTKNGNYFFDLDNLLPGDVITRNLVIQNNRQDDYVLTLRIEAKSTKGPVDLIEKMAMSFTLDKELIYQGNLAKKSGITDIEFGLIKAGEKLSAAIELMVKKDIPWEDFKAGESEAIVTWQFNAARDQPLPGTEGKEIEKSVIKLPQTGDGSSDDLLLIGWLVIVTPLVIWYNQRQQRH